MRFGSSSAGRRSRLARRRGRRKVVRVPGRDTKTKYQGVFARHQQACATTASGQSRDCNCTPSYYGVVWDPGAGRQRKTRRFPRAGEAGNARDDLVTSLREGKLPASTAGPRLDEVRDKFVEAAREGVALNKWGRRYRRRAWEDLESALKQIPESVARRRLGDVRRGDVQRLVGRAHGGWPIGLARPVGSECAPLALPLGSGPRASFARSRRAGSVARDGRHAAGAGRDPRRVRDSAVEAVGRGRRSLCPRRLRDGAPPGDPRTRLAARRPSARGARAGGRRGRP